MRKRVFTALLVIPVVLGAVLCTHPLPLFVLGVVAFLLAAKEFAFLNDNRNRAVLAIGGILFVLIALGWFTFRQGMPDYLVLLLALVGGCLSIWLRLRTNPEPSKDWLLLFESLGWIGAPILAVFLLHGGSWRNVGWNLSSPVLIVLLPIWAADTAGIFVGIALGRHKLAPSISPKKTVEGAFGSLLAALLLGILVGRAIGVPWAISIACGAAIGIFGQLGDLFESWIKRRANQKDSGSLLPGHGGILDRIDSLLFAAIPVSLLLSASQIARR